MTNKEVANQFKLLADLMELHKGNAFKVKSYQNAYRAIRAVPAPVFEMDSSELSEVRGIGKSVFEKIMQLREQGSISNVDDLVAKTPEGIVELLGVKGIGVKKIKQVWTELGVTSPGELLYACKENRLVDLAGFGEKSQSKLTEQLEYYMATADSMLYVTAEAKAALLVESIKQSNLVDAVVIVGEIARQMPVVATIGLGLVNADQAAMHQYLLDSGYNLEGENAYVGEDIAFEVHYLSHIDEAELLNLPESGHPVWDYMTQEQLLSMPPYMREHNTARRVIADPTLIESTIQYEDIKGVIHNHTRASDGSHTLQEMVDQAIANKYEYLVISDHSQAAFYANGLKPDRLLAQGDAIDKINASQSEIKVLKSVESDILNDGSLDYTNDILETLDLVIASVHTNLGMDKEKATKRLITAIENPYTTILGHPTGRLLLSRKGYPIDFKKVIEACAANEVIVELNANPARLDLDWTWLYYCLEQGVKIAINPDAHHRDHYTYMKYGVLAAQKAAMPRDMVVNTYGLDKFKEEVLLQQ